jgi:hypothetical protein
MTFWTDLLAEPRVAGAALGAAAVLLGVLLGALVNWRLGRSNARRLRRERRVDVQTALLAEIEAYLHQLGDADRLEAHRDAVLHEIEGSERFHPFVPGERHDRVFEAILSEIHILPTPSVSAVTFYYVQVTSIARLAEDLRSPGARRLPRDRLARMYRHFIEMKIEALRLGEEARTALKAGIAREAPRRD